VSPEPSTRVLIVALILLLPPCVASQQIERRDGNEPVTISARELLVPSKAQSAVEKARRAIINGKTEEAYKQVSRALAIDPHYAVALSLRSILDIEADKVDEASADCEQAIQADPGYGPPYIVLGAAYNRARRFDDAVLVLREGLELAPTAWQAHFQMGQAIFGRGNDDQAALVEITAAAQLMPIAAASDDRALVHFWQAFIFVKLKDFANAASEYHLVIEAQPSGRWADSARQALTFISSRPGLVTASSSPHP